MCRVVRGEGEGEGEDLLEIEGLGVGWLLLKKLCRLGSCCG